MLVCDSWGTRMSDRQYIFGPYRLDTTRGCLWRQDEEIQVSSRGLALLAALLEADGKPVEKSALMDAGWPNATVEESNLTVQIAALRRSLGTASLGHEWIATVPRVGYRFAGSAAGNTPAAREAGKPEARIGIAVLPFVNLSSDPEQAYFADGLAEDLITDLSKVPGLTVIARNSSFRYRNNRADVQSIAGDLDVGYLIDGSVRRAASRVRISVQLIDAVDSSHLWADRFDRELADVFALQDDVVHEIVAALRSVLPSGPFAPAQRPQTVEAYELFIRGRDQALLSPESLRTGRPLLQRAVELEPGFPDAHAWLAMNYHFGWKYWGESVDVYRPKSRTKAEEAVRLGPQHADPRWILGYIRGYDGELAEGIADFDLALKINPNQADAWSLFADMKVLDGDPLGAIECSRIAFRLNPYPPEIYYANLGWAQYAAGQYEQAVETLQAEARAQFAGSRRILAASLAQAGRLQAAHEEAAKYLAMIPEFTVSQWVATRPFRNDADRQHFVDGYLKAGLPA